MKKLYKTSILSSATVALIATLSISCTNDSPKINERIIDRVDILTTQQEDSIFSLIKELDTTIGSQIGIITIESTGAQTIEQCSYKLADSLNLGRPEYQDGILITIFLNDRAARIEVGTGLESIITNDIADFLLRGDMLPKFKEEKYGQGLYTTVDKISKFIALKKELIGQSIEQKR